MKRSTVLRSGVLVGLLVVSLSLYWAADSGSAVLLSAMIGVLVLISLAAVWLWR